MELPRAVVWKNNRLSLLDQTLLPHQEVMFDCGSVESVFEAIQKLRVRGAPAIGIAAAYGMLVDATEVNALSELEKRGAYLISARPTAVNLAWAIERMLAKARLIAEDNLVRLDLLIEEAVAIHNDDRDSCRSIGDHGVALLKDKKNLLTHCNAGSLAVSEYGTALAPIYRAAEQGLKLHVYVDETRPLLQGARLTSFELGRHDVPHTLITDNMAAHVMSEGRVDAVIVGSDRVALNGDVANKIGTLNLAILCEYFKIPFYVACPLSTIDLATVSGADIEIETRHPDEVRAFAGQASSLSDVDVYNPAFDVTPARLVTALITERGITYRPDESQLRALFDAS